MQKATFFLSSYPLCLTTIVTSQGNKDFSRLGERGREEKIISHISGKMASQQFGDVRKCVDDV